MMLQSGEYLIMRRYPLIGLCTLCIWLIAGEGFAQTVIRSTGYDVLFRPNSGRTAALSEAGVGLIGSGQAIFLIPQDWLLWKVGKRISRMWIGLVIPRTT